MIKLHGEIEDRKVVSRFHNAERRGLWFQSKLVILQEDTGLSKNRQISTEPFFVNSESIRHIGKMKSKNKLRNLGSLFILGAKNDK